MKKHYFSREFINLLKLDYKRNYHIDEIIDSLLEKNIIKKVKKNESLIPSRCIILSVKFKNFLNEHSKSVNSRIKYIYKRKVKFYILLNILWRFIEERNYSQFSIKLIESDFKFINTIEL